MMSKIQTKSKKRKLLFLKNKENALTDKIFTNMLTCFQRDRYVVAQVICW